MAEIDNQEIEVKFHVEDIDPIRQRLDQLGAKLSQPRILEINYRYDTSDHRLSSDSKVLRIRKDTKNRMTFKGPGEFIDGVRCRQEIEFSFSNFKKGQLFLNSLGFQVYRSYEKYRTIYSLENTHIMIDELPFGSFIEIESTDPLTIKNLANRLCLNWDLYVKPGYLAIYENLCKVLEINCGDLSFKDFVGTPEILRKINIFPADRLPKSPH